MISFQTCVGSAFSSHPVRWIETPEAARSKYVIDKISEKPVEKAVNPDLGKPQSKSGDILDLSKDAQKAPVLSQADSRADSQPDSRIGLKAGKSLDAEKAEKPEFVANSTAKLPSGTELTPEEKREVEELKARDQEVRIHEMAHVLAAGAYVTSGPTYTYKTGPDGRGYAVAGSVGIDTSPIAGDPEATIQKMQTVAAAALAPASPSGQDMKVAAQARQAEAKARTELAQMQIEEQRGSGFEHEHHHHEHEHDHDEDVAVFTVVRPADRVANASPKSNVADGIMPSLVGTGNSEFTPGSAYKAQSTMTLASPGFAAFA